MTRALCLILVLAIGCSSKKEIPAATPAPAPKALITQFQSVSLSGLTAQQQSGFVKLLNDEICPCSSCSESFAACLPKCKPAVLLAQWVIDRLKEGVPMEMMAQALSQEINSGFSANPQIIDIGDYSSKGSPKASMTLVEFADFECAHCKITAKSIDEFLKKHPQDIKIVYKHFPLEGHQFAKNASLAAEAAGLQGKFWPMHKMLFESEKPLDETQIQALAKKVGLNLGQFKKDLSSTVVLNKVENSLAEGQLLGISGTPALFFNGRPYYLSTDMKGLELRLAMEKARTGSDCTH
ncbi:MAG: thioredoxin domain-containing protein [Myxococcaceae bacterium]